MALAFGDYAVTEAGFAFDLGAEKFFDIKCRSAGLNPAAVVIVATVRALKMHGGLALDALTTPDPAAVERGLDNLAAHLDAAAQFGKPTLVAINRFGTDTADELAVVPTSAAAEASHRHGRRLRPGRRRGGRPRRAGRRGRRRPSPPLRPLYPLDWPIERRSSGSPRRSMAPTASASCPRPRPRSARPAASGTATCRSAWPRRRTRSRTTPSSGGGPTGFTLTVRDLEIAAGAGFVVALTGEIVRMPGLPERPAAERITSTRRARSRPDLIGSPIQRLAARQGLASGRSVRSSRSRVAGVAPRSRQRTLPVRSSRTIVG